MKFKKGVLDDHSDNFAIVFAAMGVSVGRIPLPLFSCLQNEESSFGWLASVNELQKFVIK